MDNGRPGPPRPTSEVPKQRVVGIGLNKTGTKTLRACLREWGYRHRTYDREAFASLESGDVEGVLDSMDDFDSFEDWPWPLLYREIDARYPDARFVLTTRADADTWYRSLCKMTVRIGPLDVEEPVYGHAMPQGHRSEHIEFYERHNREVRAHFADRPGKLIEICWERDGSADRLADFLGEPRLDLLPHVNHSDRVYSGDVRWIAQLNRVAYQRMRAVRHQRRRAQRFLTRLVRPTR